MIVPLLIGALAAFYAATGGCSASSSITGGGGCESFCNKIVGARCRNGPTRESCLEQCFDRQRKCEPETNALLKCATIESTIACETGSGQPRVLGCVPRETAQDACIACERFCDGWAKVGCPHTPSKEECLIACLDKRCRQQHLVVANCLFSGAGTCAFDGRPAPSTCLPEYQSAASCTSQHGQPQPFRYIPLVLLDDAGSTDASEVGDAR
jgi:hypothetical protein